MLLFKIVPSTRKSLQNLLTLCYINQICKKCIQHSYQAVSYCYSRQYSSFNTNADKNEVFKRYNFEEGHRRSGERKLPSTIDTGFSKKDIEELYSQPSASLINIYRIVNNEFNTQCMLSSHTVIGDQRSRSYKCTIDVKWPVQMSFSHVSSSKKKATQNASLQCLEWLHKCRKIRNMKPVLYDSKEITDIRTSQNIVNVDGILQFKSEIKSLIEVFHTEVKSIIEEPIIKDEEDNIGKNETEGLLDVASNVLEINKSRHKHSLKIKQNVTQLPISNYKEEILSSLENNQVLIIKGDTGCGKSTQVPQFILESYEKQNKSHECNIVISQPRRISAISLAERVTREREEVIGETVGYHVRFSNVKPQYRGSILYCTTGILLRKLEDDSFLKEVSHIIIDEAHERTVHTDILLKLFKDNLKYNPQLKLIIMSASINAELFQQYFSCGVINVPGNLFPVKMHFIEDIPIFKHKTLSSSREMEYEIPYDKLVSLIKWIVTSKPPGAILCFLPGWQEIKQLYRLLQNGEMNNLLILPLHSKIENNRQKKIFEPAPKGITKIILSTDIAETGITITDISYVIDTAIRREMKWNADKYLCSLGFARISQANINQRMGRAGRVKPGESYHLITREQYNKLDLFPKAEINRVPLEEAIIICKTLCNGKALDFFKTMIDPPNLPSVICALNNLKNLGILDENENLTSLGKRIVFFSMQPSLSKAVILACIFQCLDPMLTIATVFSVSTSPMLSLEVNSYDMFKNQKMQFHETSDHIAILQYLNRVKGDDNTIFDTFKHSAKLKHIDCMRQLYMVHMEGLINSGMITSKSDYTDANLYARNNELIRAIIFSAMNQLIKINMHGYKNGYFTRTANEMVAENNERVKIKSESVNSIRKKWPSELLTYIEKLEFDKRKSCVVNDTSIISPLSVLLFSSDNIFCKTVPCDDSDSKERVLMYINNIENVTFLCDKETADLLLAFKNVIWKVVNFIIQYQGTDEKEDDLAAVNLYMSNLRRVLSDILEESSKDIDSNVNDRTDSAIED